jgi:SAM-dependent methyltransferase
MDSSELPDIPPLQEGHHPTVVRYAADRDIADRYDEDFKDNLLFQTDTRFLDEVLPKPPARVLDLGCGTGRHMVHLARRGYVVTGVDVSAHMLAQARKKMEAAGFKPELLRIDICELGRIADGTYDAAICMFSTIGIIRTEEMRLEAVREAVRILKPGGVYVCHAHNKWFPTMFPGGWRRVLREFAASLAPGCGREFGDMVMENYRGICDLFLHTFSLGELKRLVARGGLAIFREMPLNLSRTGEYRGPAPWRRANGFIVAGRKK